MQFLCHREEEEKNADYDVGEVVGKQNFSKLLRLDGFFIVSSIISTELRVKKYKFQLHV